MTLRSVLNLFDHEVWIRIRPCGKGCCNDIVLWSADWIGDDYPKEVDEYLEWDADDLSVEMHHDFDKRAYSPMVVVCVYNVDVRKEPI